MAQSCIGCVPHSFNSAHCAIVLSRWIISINTLPYETRSIVRRKQSFSARKLTYPGENNDIEPSHISFAFNAVLISSLDDRHDLLIPQVRIARELGAVPIIVTEPVRGIVCVLVWVWVYNSHGAVLDSSIYRIELGNDGH